VTDDGPREERALLIVAHGQSGLLEALRELVAELGWVDVIENRKGASLLPRSDRVGRPFLAT